MYHFKDSYEDKAMIQLMFLYLFFSEHVQLNCYMYWLRQHQYLMPNLICVPSRVADEVPLRSAATYSSSSERPSSSGRPKKRRGRRTDGYDTDGYMSSGDELDDEDFSR